MKTVSFFSVLFLSVFLFLSCDKIEELVVVKIPIESLTIHIKDIPVGSPVAGSTDNDGLNPINTTKVLGYSSIEGMTEKDKKHLSRVTSIKSGSGSITITAADANGCIVKNFTFESENINPDFKNNHCSLGMDYTKDIASYADRLMMEILFNGDQDLLVSGKTDVPSGKMLNVKIVLRDIILSAKIIQ